MDLDLCRKLLRQAAVQGVLPLLPIRLQALQQLHTSEGVYCKVLDIYRAVQQGSLQVVGQDSLQILYILLLNFFIGFWLYKYNIIHYSKVLFTRRMAGS